MFPFEICPLGHLPKVTYILTPLARNINRFGRLYPIRPLLRHMMQISASKNYRFKMWRVAKIEDDFF